MEENDNWIVCRHVMDGTAEKVQVRRDHVCMCLPCSEDPTMLETDEFFILDESLLVERLKKISHELDNEDNKKKARGPLSTISHMDSPRSGNFKL